MWNHGKYIIMLYSCQDNIMLNYEFVKRGMKIPFNLKKIPEAYVEVIHLIRIIHKSYTIMGCVGWSSPSIAGQERETERVSLGMG